MNARRWTFAFAAAVLAAAIIDPLVERLSNAGFFGPGSFTDHSNADVVPALCLGFAWALFFVTLYAVRLLGTGIALVRWLGPSARELDDASVSRMLPLIFALELLTLFIMETFEQRLVLGHFLGGSVWLGGPMLASLALHLCGCVFVTMLLSRSLHAVARRVVDVVRALLLFFSRARTPRAARRRTWFVELVRVFAPLAERPTVRPPPCRPVSLARFART